MTSMKSVLLLQVALPFLVSGYVTNDTFVSNERRLRKYLLDQYDKSIRPVRNANDAVEVRLGMSLLSIEMLDESSQALYTSNWLRMTWHDFQLEWNPSEFGQLDTIHLSASEIWTPDLTIYNSNSPGHGLSMEHLTIVSFSGNVIWVFPLSVGTICPIDLLYFPFDTQVCDIKIGSWTYDGIKVNLTEWNDEPNYDASSLKASKQWSLVEASSKRHVIYYPCCPSEPFVDITFSLTLRRHSTSSLHLFLAPTISLSLVIISIFILPAGSSEKISLGVGVLVAHVLLLGEMINFIPSGHHETVPLMAHFFVANIVLVGLALVITTLINNWWSHSITRRVGPNALLKVIFLNQVVTKLLCFDFSEYTFSSKSGIDNPLSTIQHGPGGSVEVVDSDGGIRMMHDKEVLSAVLEWRQLANIVDRLFLIVYILLIVGFCLGFIGYL